VELGNLANLARFSLVRETMCRPLLLSIETHTLTVKILQYDNKLSGTIPSEIEKLSELSILSLGMNELTGSISTGIWMLPKVTYFEFNMISQLQGTIPTEIGLNSALELFIMEETSLSGSLPSGLGLLPLRAVAMSDTRLTGEIPSELASVTSLEFFLFKDTLLTGSLPASLCGVPTLEFDCPAVCGCDCLCVDEGSNTSSVGGLSSSGTPGQNRV